MLSARFTVTNDLGLHARAAANLVKCVSYFKSRIVLKREDVNRSADAKSILSVLSLAAAKGTVLEVVVEGPDEGNALLALGNCFDSGFGENSIQVQ
jgi:phosphocarrier protein HPr